MRTNRKGVALLVSAAMLMTAAFSAAPSFNCKANPKKTVKIDGNIEEWMGIKERKSNIDGVYRWAVCTDDEYAYFYVENKGNQFNKQIGVANNLFKLSNGKCIQISDNASALRNDTYSEYKNTKIQAELGDGDELVDIEFSIPLSELNQKGEAFDDITFAGTKIKAKDIQTVKDLATDEEIKASKVYSGIKIDGKFKDWDTPSTPILRVNDNENFTEVSAVWDDKFVYIYAKENPNGYESNIGLATSHDNGNFVLQTDKNQQTTIFFDIENTGSGHVAKISTNYKGKNSKAVCKYGNHKYEIAIPLSEIYGGDDAQYFNFGEYNASDAPKIYIEEMRDIKGYNIGKSKDDGSGIKYDGDFSDWKNFGEQIIDYSTAGKREGKDGSGALYFNTKSGELLGHVREHRGAYGMNDMTPFTLRFNGGKSGYLHLTARSIDNDGNIIEAKDSKLGVGEYDFVLVDENYPLNEDDQSAKMNGGKMVNIYNDANAEIWHLGWIHIKVSEDGRVESEFTLDAEKVSKRVKDETYSKLQPLKVNEMQTIEAQFQDIGQQWIGTAGASSGPYIGILLCIAVVGITLYSRKRKANN